MLRDHGILAGHSRDRAEVVRGQDADDETLDDETLDGAQQLLFEPTPPLQPPPPSRHPWAWLLRRVFAIDILTCSQCQGAMRVKSIVTEATEIPAVLRIASRARPPPLLQASRLLPILPGPPNVGHRRASGDSVLPKVPIRQWVCSLPWLMTPATSLRAGL